MAEVCVAVVRLRWEGLALMQASNDGDKDTPTAKAYQPFLGPANFDVLMAVPPEPLLFNADGRSESTRVQKEAQALALPRCRTLRGEPASEAALRFVRELDSALCTRAINVSLDAQHLPSCSSPPPIATLTPQLVLIPVTPHTVQDVRIGETLEFRPLTHVLHAAMHYDHTVLEAHSHNFAARIGEWLNQQQYCTSTDAPAVDLQRLFLRAPAAKRVIRCVHSPACAPRQLRACCRRRWEDKENAYASVKPDGCEFERAVRCANAARAEMLRLDKYDRYACNPLFGANIPCKRRALAPAYFVKYRRTTDGIDGRHRKRSTEAMTIDCSSPKQERSPTEFWEQQYPLHKHAFDGNAERIRELLAQGYDPNELDTDLWTALHYCAFYNHLGAAEVLMLHPRTRVNVSNGTGATPLHFAALNGHVYVAELILSHQLADTTLRDSTGKTALDLCVNVPKPDWQGVALLLQAGQDSTIATRPIKVEVQLIGAPSLQVEVPDALAATAAELRSRVLAQEGLQPDGGLAERIFAVWLVDSRLSLQLKAEQKVQVHLDKWTEHLEKFGGETAARVEGADGDGGAEDRVRVVLKRDARTLLGDEQQLARKSAAACSLLYGEAEAQFLRGMYPCHEKHFVPMGAIVAHRLYGAEWPSNVDAALLAHILPRHLIPSAGGTSASAYTALVAKLRAAHRSLAGLSPVQLQLHFLSLCWTLNVYGCTFFRAFMLMSKPLRGNLQVHVGLNDWGMCVLNAGTHKQVAAIELDKLDLRYKPGTTFLEVQARKRDQLVATITSPQAMLINNLLKQLKLKVQAAKQQGASSSNKGADLTS